VLYRALYCWYIKEAYLSRRRTSHSERLMGVSFSLGAAPLNETTPPEKISAAVSSLGAAFHPYADAVIENGICGEDLIEEDADLQDILTNILYVEKALHRKKLLRGLEKWTKYTGAADGGSGGGGAPGR
jgi:hypothetical protein